MGDEVKGRFPLGAVGRTLVVGHRGAAGYAPENTMASFELGRQMGADAIELDIHVTSDGKLAVIHDAEVSRTTNGEGRVRELTLAAIQALDAGAWFDPRYRGERVPCLDDVLDWARGRVPLVIEVKGEPEPTAGIAELMVAAVRQRDMLDQVMSISFHHPSMRRLKELAPEIVTGLSYQAYLADTAGAARAARADAVCPHPAHLTAALVREVHDAGLSAITWYAKHYDEGRIEELLSLGLDAILIDYPDRLRARLGPPVVRP
jgi:glycerophosphoryl diester phosphodiesterase